MVSFWEREKNRPVIPPLFYWICIFNQNQNDFNANYLYSQRECIRDSVVCITCDKKEFLFLGPNNKEIFKAMRDFAMVLFFQDFLMDIPMVACQKMLLTFFKNHYVLVYI